MLKNILQKGTNITALPYKKNFVINCQQHLEILTRDYSGSLKNILKTLSNHQVNLSNIESLKLNKTEKGQRIVVKLEVEDQEFSYLLEDLKRKFEAVIVVNDDQVPCVPWYPRDNEDLKTSNFFQKVVGTLIPLNEELDHPQYQDQEYQLRRQEISRISQSHMIGESIPIVDYTKQEEDTWKLIYRKLRQETETVMSKRYLNNLRNAEKALGFKYKIPQLRDIDAYLQSETGYRLKAASGMISQREFLNALGHRVFCCTQFIRHHSNPEYSPKPDLVHELMGHVPQFIDKEIADISQQIGILSCGVNKNDVSRLGTLYLYSLEFGAIKENEQIKAYGAGIAGCIQECQNFQKAKYEKFDPFIHANNDFNLQNVQPFYVYTESIEQAMEGLITFGKSLQKPFELYYDNQEKQLKSNRRITTHLNDQ